MVEGSRKELVQERPRKRRKLDVVVDEGPKHPIPEAASETKMDLEEEVHADTSANRGRPRSQTPQAALPSFPLPRRPNAPSRSTLALQGLDRALIEAEIVNPTTLHPFASDGDDDGGTGLGEKARKRLSELGITELFAGMFSQVFRFGGFTQIALYHSADGCRALLIVATSVEIPLPAL